MDRAETECEVKTKEQQAIRTQNNAISITSYISSSTTVNDQVNAMQKRSSHMYDVIRRKKISPQQIREGKRKRPDNAKGKLKMHYKLNFYP